MQISKMFLDEQAEEDFQNYEAFLDSHGRITIFNWEERQENYPLHILERVVEWAKSQDLKNLKQKKEDLRNMSPQWIPDIEGASIITPQWIADMLETSDVKDT